MKCGVSKSFSMVWVLDLGYEPLKSRSKIRCGFRCNNIAIAMMGLQNTTNMRDASWSSSVFFVTTLPWWAYKTHKRDACEQSDAFFVIIFMLPKRRFWKDEQTFQTAFSKHFCFVAQILYSHPLKVLRKCSLKCLFNLPKSSYGMDNIARMGLQTITNMRDASWSSAAFFVTTLQGWVYKTQQTRCMRAIRRFLCNNIARMGLQNTTNEMHASNQTLSL